MNIEEEKFGTGDGIIRLVTSQDYENLDPLSRAKEVAYPAGCPIPKLLSEKFGVEKMQQRYTEVGVWFKVIVNEVNEVNPELYQLFVARVPRQGEVGLHESGNVPDNYDDTLYPLNTLPGFSLPRIFLIASGITPSHEASSSTNYDDEDSKKLTACIDIISKMAEISREPYEFVARVAEEYVKSGVDTKGILSHVMCHGWLDEHDEQQAMDSMKKALSEFAPTLWNNYIDISDTDKIENGIEL